MKPMKPIQPIHPPHTSDPSNPSSPTHFQPSPLHPSLCFFMMALRTRPRSRPRSHLHSHSSLHSLLNDSQNKNKNNNEQEKKELFSYEHPSEHEHHSDYLDENPSILHKNHSKTYIQLDMNENNEKNDKSDKRKKVFNKNKEIAWEEAAVDKEETADKAAKAPDKAPESAHMLTFIEKDSFHDRSRRNSRIEEQQALQTLNQRLELYILQRREADAIHSNLQRQIETMKVRTAEEIQQTRAQTQKEMTRLRDARQQSVEKCTNMEREMEKMKKGLENAEKNANEQREKRQKLHDTLETLEKEQKMWKIEIDAMKKNVEKVLQQWKDEKKRADDAEKEMEKIHIQQQQWKEKVENMEEQEKNHKKEYAKMEKKYQQEVKKLTQKVAQLDKENEAQKEKRIHMANEMERKIIERTEEIEQERDQAIQAFKEVYDEKVAGYRAKLEEAGHQLETERGKVRVARELLQSHDQRNRQLTQQLETVTQQLKQAQQTTQHGGRNETELLEEIAHKNEIIRTIKASFKRKDQEFDDLMDLKVMLDLELASYRSMLEQEESRLGILSSPARKKRRFDDNDGATSPASTANSVFANLPLIISRFDEETQALSIRSNSATAIDLKGWSLSTSNNPEKKLIFPSTLTLEAGGILTILVKEGEPGCDAVFATIEDTVVSWTVQPGFYQSAGGVIILTNADGSVQVSRDLLPSDSELDTVQFFSTQSSNDNVAANRGDANSGCLIM